MSAENNQKPNTEKIFYSPEEVADHLGVNRETIYRYCRDGKIPHSRIGKLIRIPRESLRKLVQCAEPSANVKLYMSDRRKKLTEAKKAPSAG